MIFKDGEAASTSIRDVIAASGFTQVQVADRIGVTPVTVCRWGRGTPCAKNEIRVLHAIADLSEERERQLRQEKKALKSQRETRSAQNAETDIPIRSVIKASGFKHWQIAERVGINEYTMVHWLRREPGPERRERILRAICELQDEQKGEAHEEEGAG